MTQDIGETNYVCAVCSGDHYICYTGSTGLKCVFERSNSKCDMHGAFRFGRDEMDEPIHRWDIHSEVQMQHGPSGGSRGEYKQELEADRNYTYEKNTIDAAAAHDNFVEWCVRQRPDLMGTFTFEDTTDWAELKKSPPGIQRVRRALLGLTKFSQQVTSWGLIVAERGKVNQRLHLHALYKVQPGMTIPHAVKLIQRGWCYVDGDTDELKQWGYMKVEAPRSENAVKYVCKYVLKDDNDVPVFEMWNNERGGQLEWHL